MTSNIAPVIAVAPARGRQGATIRLPIAVADFSDGAAELQDVEISGVPAAFDLAVGAEADQVTNLDREKEHAPGYFQYRVTVDQVRSLWLNPRGGSIDKFALAVTARSRSVDDPSVQGVAMQFLDVTWGPNGGNLRASLSPRQNVCVLRADPSGAPAFWDQELGHRRGAVVETRSEEALHIYLVAGDALDDPRYHLTLGGIDGTAPSILREGRDGGLRAAGQFTEALNPRSNPGESWLHVGGRLECMSIDDRGRVWGVNERGELFMRRGTARSNPLGVDWQKVGDGFRWVSAGADGAVWATIPDGSIRRRTGITDALPEGDGWAAVEGGLHKVCVGATGQVWGVNDSMGIYVRRGITEQNPDGTHWQQTDGQLTHVSCHGDQVWGCNLQGEIYRRAGVSEGNPIGTHWTRIDGGLISVDVGADGRVWGVNGNKEVYLREGLMPDSPDGSRWRHVDTGQTSVICGPFGVWATNDNDDIFVRSGTDMRTFWVDYARNGQGSQAPGLVRVGAGRKVGKNEILRLMDEAPMDPTRLALATRSEGPAAFFAVHRPGVIHLGGSLLNGTASEGKRLRVRGSGFADSSRATVTSAVIHRGAEAAPVSLMHSEDRGCKVVVLDRTTLDPVDERTFPTYHDPSALNALADFLDAQGSDRIVCVLSWGAFATDDRVTRALKRCGASEVVRDLTTYWLPWALVGIPGMGENGGFEALGGHDVLGTAQTDASPADLDLHWQAGGLAPWRDDRREREVQYFSSTPRNGAFEAAKVLIFGIPESGTLSHGRRVRAALDGTTLWAVDAADIEQVELLLDPAGVDRITSYALSAEVTAAMRYDEAFLDRTTFSASADQDLTASFASDGMNLWLGASADHEAEVSALVTLSDTTSVRFSLAARQRIGLDASAGIGGSTVFECPDCDGSGQTQGAEGPVLCDRCLGTGSITAPGAKLHFYAGVLVESELGVSVDHEIINEVTYSAEVGIALKSGMYAEGDGELYAGDGRYGASGEFETFLGSEAEVSAGSEYGIYGNSAAGTIGVASPGALGVAGGGTAVLDGGDLTLGGKVDLGIGIFGVSVDVEVTVDTGPGQQLVVTAWDRYGKEAATTVIAGTIDAVNWMEDAGVFVARGADDAVRWGAGAATDTARFLTRLSTGGGCFISTAVLSRRGEQDDGPTLSLLRDFRDGYMLMRPAGRRDVLRYLQIAPRITAAIDERADRDAVYSLLWERYLAPAVEAIRNDERDRARTIYRSMVRYAAGLAGIE